MKNVQSGINSCHTFITGLFSSPIMNFVSGSEAMFADLCYFSVRSVQVKKHEFLVHKSDIFHVSSDM